MKWFRKNGSKKEIIGNKKQIPIYEQRYNEAMRKIEALFDDTDILDFDEEKGEEDYDNAGDLLRT